MQGDSHAHPLRYTPIFLPKQLLDIIGDYHRIRSALKNGKTTVPFSTWSDNHSLMVGYAGLDQLIMPRDNRIHLIGIALPQPGAAFNIREEKGKRSRRKGCRGIRVSVIHRNNSISCKIQEFLIKPHDFVTQLTNALRQGKDNAVCQGWVFVNTTHQVPFIHTQYPDFSQSAHGRHANLSVKDGHFSKKVTLVANGQYRLNTVQLYHNLDVALLDYIHAVARIALADDGLSIFESHSKRIIFRHFFTLS
jgi:hypothetical protein